MRERTLMDALRDLSRTGLTVEQQVLLNEVVFLASPRRPMSGTERSRKSREKQRDATLNVAATKNVAQKEKPPTPPKEKNIYTPHIPPKKHGTRLPEDWNPSDALWAWGKTKLGLADETLRFETSAFRDHFWASARATATKLNWDLTWKNWMREASRRGSRQASSAARRNGSGWYIKPESAEWDAWAKYGRKHSDGNLIYGMRAAEQKGLEFHVKDRWPPR
jgi:hypothetical protein